MTPAAARRPQTTHLYPDSSLRHGRQTTTPQTGISALSGDRYSFSLAVTEAQRSRAAVFKEIARHLIVHDQRVATLERRSAFVIRRLFEELVRPNSVDLYPDEFRELFVRATADEARARVTSDYIAGMTDSYAEMLFQRLFSPGTGSSSVFDAL